MEDKVKICDSLAAALRATKDHDDLVSLTLESHGHGKVTVTALYLSGFSREIDVSYCTGLKMIKKIANSFF